MNGGDASGHPLSYVIADLSSDVVSAHSGNQACVAIKSDGSAVTWGAPKSGGDAAGALIECGGTSRLPAPIAGFIRIGYPDVEYPVRGDPVTGIPRRGDPGGTENSCLGYPYSSLQHRADFRCTTADLRSGVSIGRGLGHVRRLRVRGCDG